MEDVLDLIEHEAEKIFPPRPGGMVDRHRKAKAEQHAATKAAEDALTAKISAPALTAVKVAEEMPEVLSTFTLNVNAGTTALLLPNDMNRRRAVVNSVTASAAVLLAASRNAADNAVTAGTTGPYPSVFQVPVGVPIYLESRGEVYVANASATAFQVSVLIENYEPFKRS